MITKSVHSLSDMAGSIPSNSRAMCDAVSDVTLNLCVPVVGTTWCRASSTDSTRRYLGLLQMLLNPK